MTTDFGKECYGWTKYGDAFAGLEKGQSDWFCQACGKRQAKELPQYMIPLSTMGREYARVCSICKHIQIKHRLGTYNFVRITQIVRKTTIYG